MRVAEPSFGRFLRFDRVMSSISCLFSTPRWDSTPPASKILSIFVIQSMEESASPLFLRGQDCSSVSVMGAGAGPPLAAAIVKVQVPPTLVGL
jgi:hypothetical protein